MPNLSSAGTGKQLTQLWWFGLASLVLYFILYLFEDQVLAVATEGGWYFAIPVIVAFVFSFVHGGFTARFWDILGIKARK